MDTLKKFMIVLNDADKYPLEHELSEAALVAKDKLNRLVEQRAAALKLADEMIRQRAHTYTSENADHYRGFDAACRVYGKRLRSLYAGKDQ